MEQTEFDPNDPSQPSPRHRLLAPRLDMIRTLLGGTEAMRKAGDKYLPQYNGESRIGYENRLNGAYLVNVLEDTLGDLSGKPFAEPVALDEAAPPEIVELTTDVDLEGHNLTVFCQQWFREGLAGAEAHVLVDFPKVEPRPDGAPRTLSDDRAEGNRPYWVLIRPGNLLGVQTARVGSREVLTQVRIAETVTEALGFSERTRPRIRVLEPGLVTLYRRVDGRDAWEVEDSWNTQLDYIPFVTFCVSEAGKPPLLDLAYMNVRHWQSTSDQINILTVSRFPLLAVSGVTESPNVTISPNKILQTEEPDGRYYYVEHTGAAIKAGQDDIDRLEKQMRGYGSMFLRETPGDQTATARTLDTAESTQDLKSMVETFEDAVALALDYTADWMGLPDGLTVACVKDYGDKGANPANDELLKFARTNRDISREAFLQVIRERGVLPAGYDMKKDLELLSAEASLLAEQGGADMGGVNDEEA